MSATDQTLKNRSGKIYQELKQEILDLKLKPGQLLSEAEICSRFQVSRTPVRDALRLLQEQGFVISVPYKGIFVTLLNYDKIRQIVYLRFAVETRVICDFMRIKTPLLVEDVHHLIRKQEAIIREEDFTPGRFFPLDTNMHSVWFKATGMSHLWEILQEQELHYRRFKALDITTETDFSRIIADHKRIFDAIDANDETELEKQLHRHLYYAFERTQRLVDGDYREYFESVE